MTETGIAATTVRVVRTISTVSVSEKLIQEATPTWYSVLWREAAEDMNGTRSRRQHQHGTVCSGEKLQRT